MEAANNIWKNWLLLFYVNGKTNKKLFRNNLAQFIKNNYYQEYASSLNLYKENKKNAWIRK